MQCGGFGRHIYRNQIKDMEELRQCIEEKWDSLDQRVINSVIREWHERLGSCISGDRGHFEHAL